MSFGRTRLLVTPLHAVSDKRHHRPIRFYRPSPSFSRLTQAELADPVTGEAFIVTVATIQLFYSLSALAHADPLFRR